MRPISKVAENWWDYTTLDKEILMDAAKLTIEDMKGLQREGFKINFFDTIQEFFAAEALEYIESWMQSTPDNPVGVCGPIGPTEQLPIVAQMVNAFGLELGKKEAHFWGMDEWVIDGKAATIDHPLSFAKADMELCFNRIKPEYAMKKENIHFPDETITKYEQSWEGVRCALMQGGQGETKHWAFNDPVRREGAYKDNPPTPEEYLQKGTRVLEVHPITVMQNARTSGGGNLDLVPNHAVTVGPKQTFKADKISIWHPGWHDNTLGMRLSALMISKKIADSACPMSLLSKHPNVVFNYYAPGFGSCEVEMH